jgi:FkbM family methyltransferase
MRGLIARALVSSPIVRAVDPITRRRVRHRGIVIQTDHEAFAPYTRAELFWGLYERTEISFIRRFLRDSTAVIEFGAGLGVASAHIASQMRPGGVLICVEANPAVLSITRRNLEAQAQRANVNAQLVHAALAEQPGETTFVVESNLFASHIASSRAPDASGATTTVRTVTLQSIRDEHGLDAFDLVCDIEGAEAQFIAGADIGLEGCERLIIELHPCSHGELSYSVDDLVRILRERWDFEVLAMKDDVAALQRHPH